LKQQEERQRKERDMERNEFNARIAALEASLIDAQSHKSNKSYTSKSITSTKSEKEETALLRAQIRLLQENQDYLVSQVTSLTNKLDVMTEGTFGNKRHKQISSQDTDTTDIPIRDISMISNYDQMLAQQIIDNTSSPMKDEDDSFFGTDIPSPTQPDIHLPSNHTHPNHNPPKLDMTPAKNNIAQHKSSLEVATNMINPLQPRHSYTTSIIQSTKSTQYSIEIDKPAIKTTTDNHNNIENNYNTQRTTVHPGRGGGKSMGMNITHPGRGGGRSSNTNNIHRHIQFNDDAFDNNMDINEHDNDTSMANADNDSIASIETIKK
jgi:hypothetical protein